jgi:hypothetical protein
VEVRRDEGVAIRIDPESCATPREGCGEALTGEHVGQPLSRERLFFRGADGVQKPEGNTVVRASASARLTPRGRRTWHAWTLLVWEPGDLQLGRLLAGGGPHREGEEP